MQITDMHVTGAEGARQHCAPCARRASWTRRRTGSAYDLQLRHLPRRRDVLLDIFRKSSLGARACRGACCAGTGPAAAAGGGAAGGGGAAVVVLRIRARRKPKWPGSMLTATLRSYSPALSRPCPARARWEASRSRPRRAHRRTTRHRLRREGLGRRPRRPRWP